MGKDQLTFIVGYLSHLENCCCADRSNRANCILIPGGPNVSPSYELLVDVCRLNHTVPGVSYCAKFDIHMRPRAARKDDLQI
jgi:hypothetical protein